MKGQSMREASSEREKEMVVKPLVCFLLATWRRNEVITSEEASSAFFLSLTIIRQREQSPFRTNTRNFFPAKSRPKNKG